MNSYDYMYKFIVIGDSGVGKSCLVLQFIDKRARKNHDITIGVEFGTKVIKVKEKNIKLQIWDTAGQENFRSIARSYYRSAAGGLLVYDVTSEASFKSVEEWVEEIRLNANHAISVVLVANKCDQEGQRVVSRQQGEMFARQHGMIFIETSAITSHNVEQAFILCAEAIQQKVENKTINLLDENSGVKLGLDTNSKIKQPKQPKKSGCC